MRLSDRLDQEDIIINPKFQGQRIRELYAAVPVDSPSLGMSLQWTSLTATEDIWHILDVTPNSPADVAGLLPYGDYVIGSPEGLVRGESGLQELVEDVRFTFPSSTLMIHWETIEIIQSVIVLSRPNITDSI